jgi:hypothetical protein
VTDVPAVSVTVTEHRLYQCRCACGMVTTADAALSGCLVVEGWPDVLAWEV